MQMVEVDTVIGEIERAIKTKAAAEHITAGEAAGLLFSEKPALYAAYDRANARRIKAGESASQPRTEEPVKLRVTEAETKINTLAAAILAREPGLGLAEAKVKVLNENPKLYAAYDKEHRAFIRRGGE